MSKWFDNYTIEQVHKVIFVNIYMMQNENVPETLQNDFLGIAVGIMAEMLAKERCCNISDITIDDIQRRVEGVEI